MSAPSPLAIQHPPPVIHHLPPINHQPPHLPTTTYHPTLPIPTPQSVFYRTEQVVEAGQRASANGYGFDNDNELDRGGSSSEGGSVGFVATTGAVTFDEGEVEKR